MHAVLEDMSSLLEKAPNEADPAVEAEELSRYLRECCSKHLHRLAEDTTKRLDQLRERRNASSQARSPNPNS